nr:hypothetical protein Iba_chr05dCG4570 [Ipomoea batatas]
MQISNSPSCTGSNLHSGFPIHNWPTFTCMFPDMKKFTTSLPSANSPLYTQPNPPSPKRLWDENPFVASASSSYVNQALEFPMPAGSGEYTKLLCEPLPARLTECWDLDLKNDASGRGSNKFTSIHKARDWCTPITTRATTKTPKIAPIATTPPPLLPPEPPDVVSEGTVGLGVVDLAVGFSVPTGDRVEGGGAPIADELFRGGGVEVSGGKGEEGIEGDDAWEALLEGGEGGEPAGGGVNAGGGFTIDGGGESAGGGAPTFVGGGGETAGGEGGVATGDAGGGEVGKGADGGGGDEIGGGELTVGGGALGGDGGGKAGGDGGGEDGKGGGGRIGTNGGEEFEGEAGGFAEGEEFGEGDEEAIDSTF